jgi:hypothetical protein
MAESQIRPGSPGLDLEAIQATVQATTKFAPTAKKFNQDSDAKLTIKGPYQSEEP